MDAEFQNFVHYMLSPQNLLSSNIFFRVCSFIIQRVALFLSKGMS